MKPLPAIAMALAMTASLGTAAVSPACAQVPPSRSDIAGHGGLHQAAHTGDVAVVLELVAAGTDLEARDRAGRTALHLAAFASQDEVVRTLAAAGADMNALENGLYDIVTIAAVANDHELVDLALSLDAGAGNITSRYQGTALIAAAHLGHFDVVRRLIAGGAPLDHVNNLGWTALMEAVVLGDGGPNHLATVTLLVEAGADTTIGDRQGVRPIVHARLRGYDDMVAILARTL